MRQIREKRRQEELTMYQLRKAVKEDSLCLLEWKNDPDTLFNSKNHQPVSLKDHEQWLSKVLDAKDRVLMILEKEEEPVGQLRFDLIKANETENKMGEPEFPKLWEISYTVAPKWRGKGIGEILLLLAEEKAKAYGPIILYAEVLKHNDASRKLFTRLGYVEEEKDDLYIYKKAVNMVFIRTDSNSTIATGHLMRCSSIAEAAKEKGAEVIFITADRESDHVLKEKGWGRILLNTDWQKPEEESEQLIKVIRRWGISKLLIDGYQVTYDYLSLLSEAAEIIYLDDLDAFCYPVQKVICYAGYADELSYGKHQEKTTYYLGPRYMPIRSLYLEREEKMIKEKVEKILLLSGGSDPYHMIKRIVSSFLHEEVEMMVVLGRFYEEKEDLLNWIEQNKDYPLQITMYEPLHHLKDVMAEADLCISAGGSTLYELSLMGVPAITYSFADNQQRNVLWFEKKGYMAYGGDGREEGTEEKIKTYYDQIKDDRKEREKQSKALQFLIDGKGAGRIARLLMS